MCLRCITIEARPTDAFGERLVGMMNEAALALMISIGHRTGLFEALREAEWQRSTDLAERAGLSERYVREWLGAMVLGQVVDYDPAEARYHLPDSHAELLTGESDNFGAMMQYFAVLGSVEDRVVECFRHGGGVPYSAYDRFHEVMAAESAQTVVAALEPSILPLVPGLLEALERGIDVADVGCGSGRAMLHLAARFPRSRFCGVDFSPEAIGRAREAAAARGLDNVRFELQDAATWDAAQAYDLVTTFDAVHDQAAPDRVLRNIARALRPDGTYLMQDIDASSHLEKNLQHPLGPFGFTISTMHCMTVSLANGGMGLGAMWGEERARHMLADAGLAVRAIHRLGHDPMNYYLVAGRAD